MMTVFMNVEAIKEAGGGGYMRTGSWNTHTHTHTNSEQCVVTVCRERMYAANSSIMVAHWSNTHPQTDTHTHRQCSGSLFITSHASTSPPSWHDSQIKCNQVIKLSEARKRPKLRSRPPPPAAFLTPDSLRVAMHASEFFLSYWVSCCFSSSPLRLS